MPIGVPFMQYPFPRKPDPAVAPSPPVPATQAGPRAGVLGASLHPPVSSPVAPQEMPVEAAIVQEPSEKQKLIDYCASAGVPIDKRWGVEKIKTAIAGHKAP